MLNASTSGSEVNKVDGQNQDDPTWISFVTELNSNANVLVEGGGGDGQFNGPFLRAQRVRKLRKYGLILHCLRGWGS
ncbi:hypothetical protein [Pseudoalteromonas sp. B62]|uniref:hypothetical protein n=1 Tax=Pseudoalteromonas sp. B62 TaxID=630483 RepID=UPI00301BDA59